MTCIQIYVAMATNYQQNIIKVLTKNFQYATHVPKNFHWELCSINFPACKQTDDCSGDYLLNNMLNNPVVAKGW